MRKHAAYAAYGAHNDWASLLSPSVLMALIATACVTFGVARPLGRVLAFGPHEAREAHVCSDVPAGFARCHAILMIPDSEQAPSGATNSAGYHPADLQAAYNLPSSTAGRGQTIAVVDAYDDPTAESDLATYRAQFGLPVCSTANGCFRKVDERGDTNYPKASAGWAQETSLDLDMVSAICPNCHILLVEASSGSLRSLGTSVNTAVRVGATVISNSYGGTEFSGETNYDVRYYNHPGVTITASSGDGGYGVQYPAASPYVIAVGGTALTREPTATRGWSETTWSGTGSGCSSYEPKPIWQADTGCAKRTDVDVSAVADPMTGVAVYDSYASQGPSGWLVFGGTSVAAPIIAGVYALAGNAIDVAAVSSPYSHVNGLNDVTGGSNGSCSPPYLCVAGPGYDGPTGLGTPNGTGAF